MNERRIEQAANLPRSRTAHRMVEGKSPEAKQARRYLVEFLLALKQVQIAQKQASVPLKPC
jgi:hypothetical protein